MAGDPRGAEDAINMALQQTHFTLPWRGRVDRRSEAKAVGVG